MTGFYVFFTNIFVGKIDMFGGGLANIFVMLTLRGSVSVCAGGIFSDVAFPINKQFLVFGSTFI